MSLQEAWEGVASAARRLQGVHLRDLFAADPDRFERCSWQLDDLTLDASKEKLDGDALNALLALAEAAGVEARRNALFAGEAVNVTEGRAALHMALRGGAVPPEGADVAGTLERFLALAEDVRSGACQGSGGPFTDVVNIGIGGSDLGPAMAAQALAPDSDGPRLHFVSNVDGAHLADVTAGLDPRRTLVIVASKTFTTLETMTNARSARAWLEGAVGPAAGAQMAAISTNVARCRDFGIDAERVFGFWDWVGGRYSIWSAIGLPLAIGIGAERFRQFLAGGAAMDRHFQDAPAGCNLPILLGLIGVWRRNAMGWPTVALIPYDQRLARFPAYVQQLVMESNGKRVTTDGQPVRQATSPIIWGEPGTSAQHSFFQLIHEGTDIVPVDFIAAARPRSADAGHHALLLASCVAQSQALAFGHDEAEVRAEMAAEGMPQAEIDRLAPHRTFPGDRPSTTLVHRELTPYALGRLIALYEHKVFVEGAVWDINAFDQWGVELGKKLAKRIIPAIRGETAADPASCGLVTRLRALQESEA